MNHLHPPPWRERLLEAFRRWGLRHQAPEPWPIELTQRRVYVLPSKAGLVFAITLFAMFLAAINYSLSLGHALVFLLVSLGFVALLATFRNLVNLRLEAGHTPPVHAGQTAYFGLVMENPDANPRLALRLWAQISHPLQLDLLPARSRKEISLGLPTSQRGRLHLPRLTLETRFPLGLIRAWAYAAPAMSCIVYPAPAPQGSPPAEAGRGEDEQHHTRLAGGDDFADLKRYETGEPLQHVAWRAAARQPDQPLLSKQFSSFAADQRWLDWDSTPAHLDLESRLSLLTRWTLDAHQSGQAWGLRLPSGQKSPAQGNEHLHTCLEMLALYGLE